jgi:hypothetical protein
MCGTWNSADNSILNADAYAIIRDAAWKSGLRVKTTGKLCGGVKVRNTQCSIEAGN